MSTVLAAGENQIKPNTTSFSYPQALTHLHSWKQEAIYWHPVQVLSGITVTNPLLVKGVKK